MQFPKPSLDISFFSSPSVFSLEAGTLCLLAKEPATLLGLGSCVGTVVNGLLAALCALQLALFVLEDVASASSAGMLCAAAVPSGNTIKKREESATEYMRDLGCG